MTIQKEISELKGFRCEGVMMFCLSGGDNIISEKMELFMDCYNPIHNYEATLNIHLRHDVWNAYEYWLEGIPQAVHQRLEEKQVWKRLLHCLSICG
jgi:hypothetical protein